MNLINLIKLSQNYKEVPINFNKFKYLTKIGGGRDEKTEKELQVQVLVDEILSPATESDIKSPISKSESDPAIPLTMPTIKPVIESNPVIESIPVIESNPVNDKHLLIILVGLPKCGKTQISIGIMNELKGKNIKSKFIETPLVSPELQEIKYLDTINKFMAFKLNVIICNGNNYLENTRKHIIDDAIKHNYKVLLVDFVHSDDLQHNYINFKSYCLKIVQNRVDSLAYINLDNVIRTYQPVTETEIILSNYLKLNINNTKKLNINEIVLKTNEILNI